MSESGESNRGAVVQDAPILTSSNEWSAGEGSCMKRESKDHNDVR